MGNLVGDGLIAVGKGVDLIPAAGLDDVAAAGCVLAGNLANGETVKDSLVEGGKALVPGLEYAQAASSVVDTVRGK